MIINSKKILNKRIKNIIRMIFIILAIVAVVFLVVGIVFVVIGSLAKLSLVASFGRFCVLIFVITAVVLIPIIIIILIYFIVFEIKHDRLKKLLKRIIPTFTLWYVILTIICFIKYKFLQWADPLFYSLLATFSPLIFDGVGVLKKDN